ncbi:MAG TPA: RsmE family RNA methyltransferase, partial [Ignavibacteriaceae bacterium]|nr:RsmE family RNA methyltransferase [Ignavibacteriaceae bacterium]
MEYLSNIQLYFSEDLNLITDETEVHHIQKVMRHNIDDIIYVTDGKGTILKSKLTRIGKSEIIIEEIEKYQYENVLKHISLCIPLLKNPDRFTFAIEKTIELGFTNFIIYQPKITIKKEFKKERIEKLGIAAMKQSLRSFLPKFEFIKELNQLD